MRTTYLGIMACEKDGVFPFAEKNYYRHLCLMGHSLGMCVYVFSPLRIHWHNKTVTGYTFSIAENGWQKESFPFPNLIYDRCFCKNKASLHAYRSAIVKFRSENRIQLLGHGLKGKWDVYQLLHHDPKYHPYLPSTEIYSGTKSLLSRIRENFDIFLKPHAGFQGRGVLHISKTGSSTYLLRGRDRRNQQVEKHFSETFPMLQWVKQFIGNRRYLVQQYLTLTKPSGEAYDIRALTQKNERGRWRITGEAVRLGKQGSVTSNLHGGGHAEEIKPFLAEQFGQAKTEVIISTVRELSLSICSSLEESHGRLVELGIDFGIDRESRIWILEVNSKPGRSVFQQLNNKKATTTSIRRPIHYARYLLDRQLGG